MSEEALQEYELFVQENHLWNPEQTLEYLALGLVGEAGEYAGKVKKKLRDNVWDPEDGAYELGDVLWYLTNSAHHLGFTLTDIMAMNMSKLQSRAERNVIRGSGDHR